MAFRGCSSDSKTMFSCNCSYLLLCLQENFNPWPSPWSFWRVRILGGEVVGCTLSYNSFHVVMYQLKPAPDLGQPVHSTRERYCSQSSFLWTVCIHPLSSLSLFLSILSSLTLSLSWCHLPCHYLSRGSCLMGYTWPRKDKNCQNFKPSLANIPAPLFWLVCLAQPTQSTSLGTLQCWTIKSQVCFFSGKSEAEDGNTSDGP